MRQAKQKGGRETDLFDIDTNIRPEREQEGSELRRYGEDLKGVFTDTEKQLIKQARGKTFQKSFEGKSYEGKVRNDRAFRDATSGEVVMGIRYEDGDQEDLPLEEIFAAFTHTPKNGKVKRGDTFRKDFGQEGIWTGTVVEDTRPFDGWIVEYSDGSRETLPRQEVEDLVRQSQEADER